MFSAELTIRNFSSEHVVGKKSWPHVDTGHDDTTIWRTRNVKGFGLLFQTRTCSMIGPSSGLHRADAMRRTFSNRCQFSTTATVFPVDLAGLRHGGETFLNCIRVSLRYELGAKRG